MNTSEMFNKSILIVSHPDDEILWFSSILDKVDEVVFCFSGNESNPQWTIGRKKSLSEHPMKNISCLDIIEVNACDSSDWQKPVLTEYGIKIYKKEISDNYKGNYPKLAEGLKDKLLNCHNVFTHNPWGEYGNEEHIQIYRIVKKYQEEMKFNLWFSNYCSNKSYPLMLKYISGFASEYVILKTNKILSHEIEKIYKKNGCWTWFEDWVWFNEEAFMKDEDLKTDNKIYGHIFPLNMIKKDFPLKGLSRVIQKLRKVCGCR